MRIYCFGINLIFVTVFLVLKMVCRERPRCLTDYLVVAPLVTPCVSGNALGDVGSVTVTVVSSFSMVSSSHWSRAGELELQFRSQGPRIFCTLPRSGIEGQHRAFQVLAGVFFHTRCRCCQSFCPRALARAIAWCVCVDWEHLCLTVVHESGHRSQRRRADRLCRRRRWRLKGLTCRPVRPRVRFQV